MIERKIVAQKLKEFQIQEFISQSLRNSGQSHTKVQRTPMGEKIIVFTSRPGMIVGRKGQNIKKLTLAIKKRFALENPQIEIAEVDNIHLNAQIVAERIAQSMERFGSQRFKGIAHQVMQDVMGSNALGVEIVISGKVPSTRAKSWRFYQGYLKKCGDIAIEKVSKAYATAKLKSGVVGIKVSIMPPDTVLPDELKIVEEEITTEEGDASEAKDAASVKEESKEETKEKKPRKKRKKKEESKEEAATEEVTPKDAPEEAAPEQAVEAAPEEKSETSETA